MTEMDTQVMRLASDLVCKCTGVTVLRVEHEAPVYADSSWSVVHVRVYGDEGGPVGDVCYAIGAKGTQARVNVNLANGSVWTMTVVARYSLPDEHESALNTLLAVCDEVRGSRMRACGPEPVTDMATPTDPDACVVWTRVVYQAEDIVNRLAEAARRGSTGEEPQGAAPADNEDAHGPTDAEIESVHAQEAADFNDEDADPYGETR